MSRLSSPRAALPPTDHVARELLKRGARDAAMLLLRAAVRRDPGERACAALIKALEARPDAAVSGPELTLDLPLIDHYVARGMLIEARAVLAGAGLDAAEPGAERARTLETLLAPVPPDAAPALAEAFRHLMTGGASLTLSLLEEYLQRGESLPLWAESSRAVLRRLLLDDAFDGQSGAHASTASGGLPAPLNVSTELAVVVGRLIGERDLRGASERLRTHCAGAPGDRSAAAAAAALGRLVEALDVRDGVPADQVDTRTLPMGPQKVADLNLRMGNLPEAERLYRRVLLDEPMNAGLRAMLDDVQAVRSFLDSPAAIAPTPLAGVSRKAIDAAVAEIAVRPTEPLPVVDYDARQDVRAPSQSAGDEAAASAPAPEPQRADDITRRVLSSDMARAAAATVQRTSPPGSPSSAPALSKRSAGPSGAFGAATGYAPSKAVAEHGAPWDDDETGVLEPALEAELLLRKGFADRALAAFRLLVEVQPSNGAYRQRLAEIEALVAGEQAPLSGDVTVRRDLSDLQKIARPTGVRLSVPEDVRAAAAAAAASGAHVPGTLDAPGIPQGQFDDDAPTGILIDRRGAPAPAAMQIPQPAEPADRSTVTVQVTRIVVVGRPNRS